MIRPAGHHLPCHTRKLLYQTFVLPNLDYCSVVWNSCGVMLSNKLEQIQNYALRLILRKPPRTSSAELRVALGWTTLKTRRNNAILCQVHRCLRKEARCPQLPHIQIPYKLKPKLFHYQRSKQNSLEQTKYQLLSINF